MPGLNNLGCTCYLNATLQALFSIQVFRDELLHQAAAYVESGDDVVCALVSIFKEMRDTDDKNACDTTSVYEAFVKQFFGFKTEWGEMPTQPARHQVTRDVL